ncbi:MAG: hypothetical protein LBM01_02840 [Christensenellaceae bacterium]|jgi:hypothetical protein|nr:hypothetical protein [Christensenellaceae bacterium]
MQKDLLMPAILGLGIYAQANNVNIATNTTSLLSLFMMLQEGSAIEAEAARITRLEAAMLAGGNPYLAQNAICAGTTYAQPVVSYTTPTVQYVQPSVQYATPTTTYTTTPTVQCTPTTSYTTPTTTYTTNPSVQCTCV